MKTFLEVIKEELGEDYIGNIFSYHGPNDMIERHGGFEAFAQHAQGEVVNDKTIYIGAELEIGCTNDHTSSEFKEKRIKIMNTIPCILESDSSISHDTTMRVFDAVEIITAPMTIARWRELAPQIKELFKELSEFGYKSHQLVNYSNTGTCGLHMHFTVINKEKKADVVNRLWHQMHTWEEQVHKIAGRKYVGYAHDLDSSDALVPEEKLSIAYIDKKVKQQGDGPRSDHASAINLQHENTIEIRLCRGTLNFTTFMARLEFFYNMYIQANALNIITQRMTWNKLVKGKYIESYVEANDITTLKKAYDYTTKIQVLEKSLIKYDKTLLNCIIETLQTCKNLKNDGDKLQKLGIQYEVNNLIDYSVDALQTLTKRFMTDTNLKSIVTKYMTTYSYTTTKGANAMKELIKPLYDLLTSKPSLQLENATESDV